MTIITNFAVFFRQMYKVCNEACRKAGPHFVGRVVKKIDPKYMPI